MSTAVARVTNHRSDTDPARGFTSPRDFLTAVYTARRARGRDSVTDHRLRALAVREGGSIAGPLAFALPLRFTPPVLAAAGSDEQGTYADPYGGYAVRSPAVTRYALGAVESDPTAGRTLVLPMDTPELHVLARTDKDHSTSVTGGLEVTRTPETVSRASSRMKMEAVSLTASSLFGFGFATEELLEFGPDAFAAILEAGYRDEFGTTVLREKLTGGGGNEFLGVLSAPTEADGGPRIEVAKEGGQSAGTIVGANVIAMRGRCWGYSRAIWLGNHHTYEQLVQTYVATGAGPKWLYIESDDETKPDMLAGRPIFYTEHLPALGAAGDLVCVDWSQYLEGIYRPLETAESVHVRWEQHERAFKFWTRNAGAPWWRSVLTPENGAATLSPIVSLVERA